MKRTFFAVLTLIILAFVLTACSSSGKPADGSNAQTQQSPEEGNSKPAAPETTVPAETQTTEPAGDYIEWSCDEASGTLSVSGRGPMEDYGFSRGMQEPPWYGFREKIQSLVISDEITHIGAVAFYDCKNLKELTGAGSVASIGDSAFSQDDLLRDENGFLIMNSILVLWSMDETKTVHVPDGVTGFIPSCFFGGDRFEAIELPDTLLTIGENTFRYCPALTELHIPANVQEISNGAIIDCSKLSSITVDPANQNYVSVDGVLFQKDMKTLIKYPTNADADSYAVPDGVSVIHKNAFYYGQSLKTISVPASVTEIGESAFGREYRLETIDVSQDNPAYTSVNGVLFNKDQTVLLQYPCGNKNKHYDIPETVSMIGAHAFTASQKLSTVHIPDCVTTMGDSSFYGSNLKEITVPSSVTSIGDDSFGNMNYLEKIELNANITEIASSLFYATVKVKEITIPEGVTKICEYAFQAPEALTTVNLPSTLREIEPGAFWYADSITDIHFAGTEAQWNEAVKNDLETDAGVWGHVTVHFAK